RLRAWQRQFADEGFVSVGPPAIPPGMIGRLIAEARRGRASARRGGGGSAVPQRNARGRLGPVARQFLTSPQTVQFVSAVSGFRAAPALEASCYTYYDEANHFCGV